MVYKVDDKGLDAAGFLTLVRQVWQGDYDAAKTQAALSKTINITAYDGNELVGCLRILTDGYYFGTITELLVLPAYQSRGLEANCFGSQRSTHRRCCILARNQG